MDGARGCCLTLGTDGRSGRCPSPACRATGASGLLAPLLVVVGRLLQGFSAGVELGGVSVYLAEIATPGHRGFYVSWQSGSQQVAVMFAALLGVILSPKLTPGANERMGMARTAARRLPDYSRSFCCCGDR